MKPETVLVLHASDEGFVWQRIDEKGKEFYRRAHGHGFDEDIQKWPDASNTDLKTFCWDEWQFLEDVRKAMDYRLTPDKVDPEFGPKIFEMYLDNYRNAFEDYVSLPFWDHHATWLTRCYIPEVFRELGDGYAYLDLTHFGGINQFLTLHLDKSWPVQDLLDHIFLTSLRGKVAKRSYDKDWRLVVIEGEKWRVVNEKDRELSLGEAGIGSGSFLSVIHINPSGEMDHLDSVGGS